MIKGWKVIGYDESGRAVDLTGRISGETAGMINSDLEKMKIDTSDLDDFDGVTIDEFNEGEAGEDVKNSEY